MSASRTKRTREGRMKAWEAAKFDYRNSGGRNWKARKKKIKRMLRDSRRFERTVQNSLIDNARLAA